MPKGVYERTPEHLVELRQHARKMREVIEHGLTCNCASCLAKRHDMTGKNNPNWKHGKDEGWYWLHKKAREKTKLWPQKCNRCGVTENLVTHHKDHNWRNNSIDNLEILCKTCHLEEHHDEFSEGIERRERNG